MIRLKVSEDAHCVTQVSISRLIGQPKYKAIVIGHGERVFARAIVADERKWVDARTGQVYGDDLVCATSKSLRIQKPVKTNLKISAKDVQPVRYTG